MEKILVALNPRDINTNMVDFACYLASLTHSELTAIFLDQEVEEGVSIENHLGDRIEETYMPRVLEKKSVAITPSDNSMVFQSVCKNRGIRIKILHTSRDPLSQILLETRFADGLKHH